MPHVSLSHAVALSDLRYAGEWDFAEGTVTWLRGPNGAGKSTFLENLSVNWPSNTPPVYLEQGPLNPFGRPTVEQCWQVFQQSAGQRCRYSKLEEHPWWQFSALPKQAFIEQLSGGENQLLKLMMLFALNSEAYFFDEPFQHLDQSRGQFLIQAIQLLLTEKKIVLLAHHGDYPQGLPCHQTLQIKRVASQVEVVRA